MENLDSKTLIHVGTELVLIGGLAFWLKRKNDIAEARIDELEKRLAAFEELFTQLQPIIANHDAILRKITGAPPGPMPSGSAVPKPPQVLPGGAINTGAGIPPPKVEHGRSETGGVPPGANRAVPSGPPEEEKVSVVEEEVSPEDLDRILKEELENELSEGKVLQIETEEKPLKPKRKTASSRKKKTN